MIEFQFFRVKVYPSNQLNIFESDRSRPDILKETLLSLPSVELRRGKIWHIGNVTFIDNTGLYFRIGRVSTSTIEVYYDGNFADQQFETAPYTHVLLDLSLEVCVIAKKTRLAPKPVGIANQFIRLLNKSEKAQQLGAMFEIGELSDPEDFITHLRRAYAISKFWVRFSRPNPFDADRDFIQPAQKLLDASNGETGKIELEGDNLNPDGLEAIARSAAATGDDAGATLKIEQTEGRVKKRLKGNPVNISHEDLTDDEQKRTLLERIRHFYQRLRGSSQNQ